MPLNNNLLSTNINLGHVLDSLRDNINYNLNCVKVAIVESFDKDNLTVCCRVANKRLRRIKDDGSQVLQDYPLIYAKVHYFGWGDIGATFPIEQGMEGILLFNDRELETWFLTGQSGTLAYDRCHNMSDAIFICGIHSIPNMIQIAEACLNLFYKGTDIKLKEDSIEINGNTILTGNLTQTGNLTSSGTVTGSNLVDTSGATGTFTTVDDKTVTVVNGIIKSIS